MTKRVTIDLPDDLVSFAEAKVAAGEYVSLDAAVAAGVQGLQQKDARLERWLREEVIPEYDQWIADGKPVFTEEETFALVEEAIAEVERRKAS